MLIPLSVKALVKMGAYELLGHFQLKAMETTVNQKENRGEALLNSRLLLPLFGNCLFRRFHYYSNFKVFNRFMLGGFRWCLLAF
jgi:hypothetical protein